MEPPVGAIRLGAVVRVDGQPMTVVGVAPEGFTGAVGLVATELWIPFGQLSVVRPSVDPEDRAEVWLEALGRLRAGVDREEALAFLRILHGRWADHHPGIHPPEGGIDLTSFGVLPSGVRGPVAAFVGALGALSVLVLPITGLDVAGLLLARAEERRHETTVRVVLGTSRRVLFRQWAVEAVLLFGLGGVPGLFVAHWIAELLPTLLPPLPVSLALVALGVYGVTACAVERRTLEFGVRRVLGVLAVLGARSVLESLLLPTGASGGAVPLAAVVLLLSTVGFGSLLPALRASRIEPLEALREQ